MGSAGFVCSFENINCPEDFLTEITTFTGNVNNGMIGGPVPMTHKSKVNPDFQATGDDQCQVKFVQKRPWNEYERYEKVVNLKLHA